jgi:hypothetical protein
VTYTDATAEEFKRAALFRSGEIRNVVSELRGQLGLSHRYLGDTLDLIGEYPDQLEAAIDMQWNRNPNPVSRSQILIPLLRQTNIVADFIENNLAHGTRMELSESLENEIVRELSELGLPEYGVVTSHGPANNFLTQHTPDLRDHIFGPLNSSIGKPTGTPKPMALFKIPRIEGSGVQWRPILLGHEVGHVAVQAKDALKQYRVWWDKIDRSTAEKLHNPRSPGANPYSNFRGIQTISESLNRPGNSGDSPAWERGWNHGKEANWVQEVSV